ncbi:MAG: DNA translocase FtsK [Candidatus Abyssobacteria bacterium SURF_17]|uniref:DNA translocase FtsK n=1 Tax=Candidatus Abyssobacteria bacterium SURF_17 TaxID=2093361 RepID=A0A419ETT7_9BACT|nr:MAG: DNA translocase FtsK [Candidatus Abyssubacteria bacterium SURF_17]
MRTLSKLRSNLKSEILGFVLLCVAAVIFLSLASYDPLDTHAHSSSPNVSTKNMTGVVGAYLAEGLFFTVGIGAYLLPPVLLIWAWNTFWSKMGKDVYFKLIGLAAMLLSVSGLVQLLGIEMKDEPFAAGGVMGPYVADLFSGFFGLIGAEVVVFTFLIISVLLATEFLFFSFAMTTGMVCGSVMVRVGRFVYEGITGNTELPGGLSLAPRRKRIRKPEPEEETPDKPVAESESREPIKINEPKTAKPSSKVTKKPSTEELPRTRKARKSSLRAAGDFELPPVSLLSPPQPGNDKTRRQALEDMSELLESTLQTFGIEAQVVEISRGPAVTRFELKLAPGIKVNRILALSDDLALALEAYRVRIEAPIPGKAAVGIEVPNKVREDVCLREVIDTDEFHASRSKLTIALGKTITGDPLVVDLAGMPHLLIAGATGSGKTICVNSLIASILFNATPEDVRFMMIDPKVVELSQYNGIPHLLWPVITDAKEAGKYLHWLVNEMEERYKILAQAGARNIESYNQKVANMPNPAPGSNDLFEEHPLQPLPYIVTVIDELADLMMVASIEVEDAIMRLAQLARAVGIHLVLATQRPSVDVITGVIKANFPARISFQVSSRVDSRTVLDMNGAEKLIGKGDLLYLPAGLSKPIRAQGVYITDHEINRLVEFLTAQREAEYLDPERECINEAVSQAKESDGHDDPLYDDAVRLVLNTQQASISMIQRRLRVGYARAARLIDMMELDGIVGPSQGSQVRDILVGQDYLRSRDREYYE